MRELEWRDIPGCPGYQVSAVGQVRRTKAGKGTSVGRVLSGYVSNSGYQQFDAWDKGTRSKHYVHRAVALAFIGPPPTAWHEVAHYDGDKQNNRVENLRWATRAENIEDNRRLGVLRVGEEHSNSRLTEAAVVGIRRRRQRGMRLESIAREFGTTLANVSAICLRQTWKHVA
jgi:HNH endonuclease